MNKNVLGRRLQLLHVNAGHMILHVKTIENFPFDGRTFETLTLLSLPTLVTVQMSVATLIRVRPTEDCCVASTVDLESHVHSVDLPTPTEIDTWIHFHAVCGCSSQKIH